MSPGLERCPPAQPRGKGREAPAAKLLAADAAGRGPALGVGGKAPPEWAGMWTGLCSQGCRRSHLVPGGSVLQRPREGVAARRMVRREGWGLRAPHPLPPSRQNRLWINNYSLFTSDHMALGNRCAGNEEPGSN